MIAICVGLAIKKQLRAGIVYNPITKELYTAQAGRGALKNGFPIHVSATKGKFSVRIPDFGFFQRSSEAKI